MKVLILLLFPFIAFSQFKDKLKEDLKKVSIKVESLEAYSYKVSYKSYKNRNSEELIEEETAYYTSFPNNRYYFEKDEIITVSDGTNVVVVDEDQKHILVLTQSQPFLSTPFPVDTLLKYSSEVKLVSQNNNKRIYRIGVENLNLEFSDLEVEINTDNWFVSKVEILYQIEIPFTNSDGLTEYIIPRMEIQYLPIEIPVSHKEKCKMEYYISEKGEVKIPSKHYTGYEIIDQS